MTSWYEGEKIHFYCISCNKRTTTTMTPRGRKNTSSMCRSCRKEAGYLEVEN